MIAINKLNRISNKIKIELIENERYLAYEYFFLGAVVLIAAALRFYKLGEWSFWIDEMATIANAQNFFENINRSYRDILMAHPTTSLLIWASIASWGTNEWSARLAPALMGILTVPILYFPIRRIFNSKIALSSGLLLAIASWHVYFSQNARYYILLLLFYTLALLAFYYAMENDRPLYLLFSLLLLGLATSERLTAIFFVPVIISYLLLVKILPFEKPKGLRLRNLLIFFLPCLLIGLFFASKIIQDPSQWISTFVGRGDTAPLAILKKFILNTGHTVIFMGSLGGIYLLTNKSRAGLLLSINAFLPLSLCVVAAQFQFVDARYALITLISWIILASVAAITLVSNTQPGAKMLAIGVMALVLYIEPLRRDVHYFTVPQDIIGTRLNWKAAFGYLKEHRLPGELVVTNKPPLANYYLNEEVPGMENVDPQTSPAMLEQKGERVWFVIGGNDRVHPTLDKWIKENCTLVADYFFLYIYLYDPKNDDSIHSLIPYLGASHTSWYAMTIPRIENTRASPDTVLS